jgi:hypothetical protein
MTQDTRSIHIMGCSVCSTWHSVGFGAIQFTQGTHTDEGVG